MSGYLLQLFPKDMRLFWEQVARDEKAIQEIRLRAGRPVIVLGDKGEWMLNRQGSYTRDEKLARFVEQQEIFTILQHICHYSLYAYEDELRQGFITVAGGHRIGVTGQVVLEGNTIRTVKHISCMNIRIAHQIMGAADPVIPRLYRAGRLLNTLIISPPGCGKTTLLRDLIRQVSDGNKWGAGLSVGVVDERSEIAGCFQGVSQNDVGMRTDILDGCPKALGVMMLLRSMSPKVIAVDEIGSREDAVALHMASRCGCRILATVHGDRQEDVLCRKDMKPLMEERLFERILILHKAQGRFSADVMEGGEIYA